MNQPNTLKSAPANRSTTGPYDAAEVADSDAYADFGAVKFLPSPEVQVRLELEEQTGRVIAVHFDIANSTLQVQAFAAPKSEGLWHEVRALIRESVESQSGQSEERLGAFGPELLAKVPVLDDRSAPIAESFTRFIGVDGPRWFLRGKIGGAAINDPAAASLVEQLFRSLVVDRGVDPVPPRELLTLNLPEGVVLPPRNAIS